MTPGARIAAAIDVLDRILDGHPAEQVLTNWARGNRFAGSGDRAAIRDHVYDALRCRRSFAALGGSGSGRGLMLGALRAQGLDPGVLFDGAGHAPERLSPEEAGFEPPAALPELVALDCPDWLAPALRAALGADFAPVMASMRRRAPLVLRVNLAKSTLATAAAALLDEAIATRPHPLSDWALEVVENPRRVAGSAAYRDGWVEIQDVASQAAIGDLAEVLPGARVLDYCAGGGGKSLAMAALGARVSAHDAAPQRLKDLPQRAARAGASIDIGALPDAGFDLVLVDAPCSGSGAWRRQVEAKWALTPARLEDLVALQSTILREASAHVAPGGRLVYMTCSLLKVENEAQVEAFCARAGWRVAFSRRLTPLDGADGFFAAHLTREVV